ncbi:MAG: amino acid adenylation domain-containing protein [Candidatus Aminicenantes bacterium]|nr:amino acid adenylation domain-containing protein [Candidatus Aminicenantes bacterium]
MEEKKSKIIKDLTGAGLKSFKAEGNRISPNNDFIPFNKEEIRQSIPERFEAIVEKYPDQIALKTGRRRRFVTYNALNKKANRSAHCILTSYDDRYSLSEDEKKRYNRQLKLHGWGVEAQETLKSAAVFAAGAGGSGSPLIQQLALCGFGTIIICDDDTVELSNLNRQVLHDESRIGMNKALSAQMTVNRINPHVRVIAYTEKITADNVHRLVGDAAIIFDNVDDIETKFVLSQCAVHNNIPHILSSMIDMDAYAAVLHPPHGPCFHCLYDRNIINEIEEIRTMRNGVDKNYEKFSNPVASPALFLAAGFAVNEALKIILELGKPSYNKFFLFDQRGVKNIIDTMGYKQITYPFSLHFKETCKKQGFDWDEGGADRFVEELTVEPDPQCPLCKENGRGKERIAVEKRPVPAVEAAEEKHQRAAALLFEHGMDMITGIMGVLKTGMLYVPLDASYPVDRLEYMLEESEARVIVTNHENLPLAETLRNNVDKNIAIVNISEIPANVSTDNPRIPIEPGDLAYILYTSGSTGKPKGVMQNHCNVLHHCRVYTNALHIHAGDKLTLFSSYSFDAAKMDIYGALLNGAVLYPYNIKKENHLLQLPSWLRAEGITIYHSIPTVYRYFTGLLEGAQTDGFPRLRMIVLGGEAVYKKDVDQYKKYFSEHCLFVNGLGPTESTIALQYFIDKQTEISREAVPVGYPVEDTEVNLLTEHNREAGVLGVGEIVFKSEHLALGYWKNPELTAEKFCLDKNFSGGAGGRLFKKAPLLYKTGDLGRRLPDGAIEFVGRGDSQVKISGYRVEPGEIESKLDRAPGIKKSVVVCKTTNNGENFLTAYYTVTGQKEIDEKHLVAFLKETLPDYMIPTVFFSLPEFPLTATGKIDRKTLAQQDISHLLPSGELEVPGNETEMHLLKLWKEVLKQDAIGVNENFFLLGGNSIKAILLVSRIYRELEVKLSLVEIFKYPFIKKLAKYVDNSKKSIYEAIVPIEKQDIYPQSSAQKRLFFLAQFRETGTGYNMPAVRKLVEKPDTRKFETIFRQIIARHETLRTSFEIAGSEPVQRVHDKLDFKIEAYGAGAGETLDDILLRFVRPFDLAKAPLLRVGAAALPGEEHYLLYDLHHIICDGTSITLLYDEFVRLFAGEELPALPIQYKDFSAWQNRLLESGRIMPQEQYWLELFADAADIPRLNLPLDYPRPPSMSYQGDSLQFEAGPVETGALRRIGNAAGATLYMSLLAILNTLFYKYTGQEDIIIGVGVAGRSHAGLEAIIGMFVNMLAMRNHPHGDMTWREFLEEVKTDSLTAFENQDVQFEALVEKLELERDPAYSPLLDVMLAVQNFESPPDPVKITEKAYLSTPLRSRHKTSKFDIGLLVREKDQGLDFELEYRTTLFRRETIERLAGHFLTILKQVGENPRIPLAAMEILAPEEKRQLMEEFNQVLPVQEQESPQPRQTIHRLFAEQVRQTPDHRAVVDSGGSRVITYRHLNSRANKLGRLLREKCIGRDSIVAVMIDRSIALVEGILAILKAGGAYLPLDAAYPPERMNAMIKDSGARLLLTHNARPAPGFGPGIENLDIQNVDYRDRDDREPGQNDSAHDLLYVIYTSGSTGKPKGIMLEHRNLANLIRFEHRHTNIDFGSVLQFASIGFDVSFQEIFSTLLWEGAGTLYLIPDEIRTDIPRLFRYVNKCKIKTLFLPASFFKFLFKEEQEGGIMSGGVTHIVAAGEQLAASPRSREYLQRRHIYLHNHYGPAETHVVTTLTLDPAGDIPALPPIGRPISGAAIYILDKDRQVTPLGVPGELVIGGAQLGRGYLNNPQLTAEKFFNFHHSSFIIHHSKLYKTGDLARWRSDGNIEFLGRIDAQVKIRGFRIEPGEIEDRLLKHPEIKEAVVILAADETGEKYLCAYIAPRHEDPGDRYAAMVSQLKNYLSGQLPDYMIPTYIVPLERIPLNKNGKVDRRALPGPHTGGPAAGYCAPVGRVEETLRDIWAAALNIPARQVGTGDNFFDLGGHSLRAAVMVSKVHKQLEVEVPLSQVFKTPRIKDLAEYIKTAAPDRFAAVEPTEKQDYYPLASAQKRLYALQQIDPDSTGYNMFKLFQLVGKLDPGQLENTFRASIKRHESLRTSFPLVSGEPIQRIHEKVAFAIEIIGVTEKENLSNIKSFIRPFDLSKAPLLRVGVMRISEDRGLLMVDMHHIITDGVSHGILIRDFTRLYLDQALPDLRIQYKEYSQWQNRLKDSGELKKQETYWLNEFRVGDIPVLDLPTDFPRPPRQCYEGEHLPFTLPETLSRKLHLLAKETGVTLYMVLLAAYNVLLSRYSRREDIVVGSPVTGRRHADLQDIIGIFVNMLAIRTRPAGEKTFAVFVREVKEKVLAAMENQDYQFYELVAKLGLHGNTGRNPLFSVVMAMQNIDPLEAEAPGDGAGDLHVTPREYESNIARFDLLFNVRELENTIKITVEYSTRLFIRATATAMTSHYIEILEQVTENKNLPLKEIKISSAAAEIETAALLEEGDFSF